MYNAGFQLDPVDEVPEETQKEAAGVSLELEQEELKQAQNLESSIKKISAEYEKELRGVVGDENLERYFEFRLPLRMQMRDAELKALPTVVGENEVEEKRLQSADKSREFLKEIDFDMARASKLRGEYQARIQKVFAEAVGRPDEAAYLVLPENAPADIHNPWATYSPPYPGWAWACSWARSDEPYNPSFARYLNSAAGSLGTYTHTHVSGADNSDYAWVRYHTSMRFWYRMPAAGMVEVWMYMQCISSPYSGYLKDEWGWSDSVCDQESHARLRVIVPGPSAPRKSAVLDYRRTGTDATWSRSVAYPGQYRWKHIFSMDSYPANTWVLIEIGTEEWNRFWSNDVTIHSGMTMRWFLRNVYVRSSGE